MLAPSSKEIRDPFAYEMTQVRKQRLWKDMLVYLWPAFLEKVFHRHMTQQELWDFHNIMAVGFISHRSSTPDVTDEDYQNMMKRLMPIIKTHRAFAQFVIDKRAEISPTYIPWALNILDKENGPHYGKALMMALGEGENFAGRPCEVTSADPHYFEHVTTGWGYIEARHRSLVARQNIAESHDVLILGAGYLPELSPKFGGTLPSDLHVIACDTDTSIDRLEMERKFPGIKLNYLHTDMLSLLRRCAQKDMQFDTIIMDGVLSYNLDQADEIIGLCMQCLRPRGHLVFDLLMLHPELINLRFVLDWGTESDHPLKLMPTQGAAQRFVKKHFANYVVKIRSSTAGLYHWTSALTFDITSLSINKPKTTAP